MWEVWIFLMILLWLVIFELTDRNYDSRYLNSRLGERRLGGIERWCYSRRKFIGAFNLSIMLTVDTLLEEEKLRKSLDKMQKKYAILQSTVVEGPFSVLGTRMPCFKVLENPPKIPLDVSEVEIENDHRAANIKLMEHEINTPMPSPLLARAKVVYRKGEGKMQLLFTVDHCAADGFGCGTYIKEWIFNAMEVKPNKMTLEQLGYPKVDTDEDDDDSKFVKIPPSADAFFPPIPRSALTIWCSLWFLSFLRFLCIPWRALPPVKRFIDQGANKEESKNLLYPSLLVENQLDVEQSRILTEKCRKENCTVGTAIHTALSAAVAELVANGNKNFLMRDYLYSATNVDLRRLAPRTLPNYRDIDGLTTGYYGGFTFLTCNTLEFFQSIIKDPARLWDIAANQKQSCQHLFKHGRHMFVSQVVGINAVQKIMNWRNKCFLEHNGKIQAPMSFLLSNMGNLGGSTQGSLNANRPTLFSPDELALFPRLSSIHAAVTANNPDPQPIVGCFTFDEKLHMFAIFSAASYTTEKAQEFLDRTMEILANSIKAKQ